MRPGGPFELSFTRAAEDLGAVELPGFDSLFIKRSNAFTFTFSFKSEGAAFLKVGFPVGFGRSLGTELAFEEDEGRIDAFGGAGPTASLGIGF